MFLIFCSTTLQHGEQHGHSQQDLDAVTFTLTFGEITDAPLYEPVAFAKLVTEPLLKSDCFIV